MEWTAGKWVLFILILIAAAGCSALLAVLFYRMGFRL